MSLYFSTSYLCKLVKIIIDCRESIYSSSVSARIHNHEQDEKSLNNTFSTILVPTAPEIGSKKPKGAFSVHGMIGIMLKN